MVLDITGQPSIAFRDGKHYANLIYAHRNAWGKWAISYVDNGGGITGNTGYDPSIALDSAGNPHISYYDKSEQSLRYASWNGTSWNLETVDMRNNVGEYSSLVIDAQDRPHIGYYDATLQELKYATRETPYAQWVIRTIDNENDIGQYVKIALDITGHPCFSYYDRTNNALKYAGWKTG